LSNAIEIKNLCLYYNDRAILEDVNCAIEMGSIVGITGLSGAGKTSLIRAINGNIKNDANVKVNGDILLFGNCAENTPSRTVATVYQDPDTQIVFPNVLDEITFGMENYCFTRDEMDVNLKLITANLGIVHLLERNPNNLSGGEKQLVVLAAILCIQSKILLLDECISQVDEKGRRRVKQILLALKEQGITIVMIEHNYDNLEIVDEMYELKNTNLKLIRSGVKK